VLPLALSDKGRLPGSIISIWSTGKLGEYEIPPMREAMIALHTGGVPRFQTRIGDRWTEPSMPGQLYWIPADQPTFWRVNGTLEFVAVHFGSEALERIGAAAGISAREAARLPFRPGFHDSFAASACATLADEAARLPNGGRSLFADLLADTLAVYLVRHEKYSGETTSATTGLPPEFLQKTLDRIEQSISSGISVEILAREAGMSPSQFARAFKATVQVSPHRYLITRRIECAKDLLAHTGFRLAEIALETGFSSQAHFTDRFHEATGLTPLEFRRLGQKAPLRVPGLTT
jgi:AraC family transcriptional regulator